MDADSYRLELRQRLRDRLGLPTLSGHRSLAASLIIDSLGDGLFVPFEIVYFLHTTSLSLAVIGLSLSVAGFVAIGTVVPAGVLLDRLPAARLVIAANVLSAVGFAGYLVVSQVWQLVVFALLAAVGSRLYWTANLALIGDAFADLERPRWFAFQRALRNSAFGLGGLLGAIAISTGSPAGYRALALVNAASYLAAAALVYLWTRSARDSGGKPAPVERQGQRAGNAHRPDPVAPAAPVRGTATEDATAAHPSGFLAALTDRAFMLIVGTNLLFVLAGFVLDVLLAVYLIKTLHQPAWLAGLLFAVNTALVGAVQTTTSRAAANLRPARMLQLTAVIWSLSFAVFWLAGVLPAHAAVPVLIIAVLIYTLAQMIQGPALNDLVVSTAPEAARGRYLGVYQLSWGLGSAAAPALFSWLFTISGGLPWIALGVSCLTWAGLLALIGRRLQPVAGP